jgi:hypothetical protein
MSLDLDQFQEDGDRLISIIDREIWGEEPSGCELADALGSIVNRQNELAQLLKELIDGKS